MLSKLVPISILLLFLLQDSTGRLEGIVVDASTQKPLAGVRLQVSSLARTVTTGPDGQFVFERIEPGLRVLSGQKQGYMNLRREGSKIPGNSGLPMLIKPGDNLKLTLRLLPAPVAAGKILDERGRPIEGIRVVPLRLVYDERGSVTPSTFTPATTNDLGEYRLSNLDSGRYLLRIEPPTSLGYRPNGSLYYPAYYPGVSGTQQADTVELKSAEEVQLRNVVLRSARGATIHIDARIAPGVTPTRDFTISARREGTLNQIDAINASSSSSKTDIGPLGPGSWNIQVDSAAGNDRLVGVAHIEVEEKDLSLTVNVDTGISTKGTVTLISGDPRPTPLTGVTVRLMDPQTSRSLPFVLTSEADGSLKSGLPVAMPPGTYFTHVAGFSTSLYVAAIQAGGVDLLRNSITLRPKEDLTLSVSLGAAATVQGTVTDSTGASVFDAAIVLVPERAEDAHLYRSGRSNERGNFELSAAPGKYRLLAWPELEGAAYRDPEFMRKYDGQGRAITVESGNRLNVDLKILD